jgi:hypothetical protein
MKVVLCFRMNIQQSCNQIVEHFSLCELYLEYVGDMKVEIIYAVLVREYMHNLVGYKVTSEDLELRIYHSQFYFSFCLHNGLIYSPFPNDK